MNIIELKLETYNGMVRLRKPGHRTIVLLCDQESKDKLMPKFKEAIWPYRRNKTLLFGYLCLDRNLEWYSAILQEVLGFETLNLNKKFCIGTVLSLNGYRRYFRLYHAKHREFGRGQDEDNLDDDDDDDDDDGDEDEIIDKDSDTYSCMEKGLLDQSDSSTIGIDDSINPSSSDRNSFLDASNLLDQLPAWFDLMFEGLTKKYPLDVWPDVMR